MITKRFWTHQSKLDAPLTPSRIKKMDQKRLLTGHLTLVNTEHKKTTFSFLGVQM